MARNLELQAESSGGGGEGVGMEQKKEKLMDTDNSVVAAVRGGDG